MTTRAEAAARHELREGWVVEVDADACTLAYGVAPCTASGASPCYKTFATCQDPANFARGVNTVKFCRRGMAAPPGETVRPYITAVATAPTEIDPAKGLAMRGTVSVTLVDEPCPDHLDDPYAGGRPQPAGGTWWGRFLARNRYLVGRPARLRRGYVVDPWSWSTFETEAYIVTAISGPDGQGQVRLTLQDRIKLLDSAKFPAPTDGKLAADLPAVSHVGVVVSATSTTVRLPDSASAVDGAYVGQEIWIYNSTGAGQRRTITAYDGATRTATVAAWSVVPDATSSYEIGPLSVALATGAGAQYADPAVTGKTEIVRIGKELIRYTAKSGDVLSWSDTTRRAQGGSTKEDHKAGDQVQQCAVFLAATPYDTIRALLNAGGLADTYIDLTGLSAECTTWAWSVTLDDILSAPESVSTLLSDLLVDLDMAGWWDAVAQKAKFRFNRPEKSTELSTLTDADMVLGSVKIEPQDKDRLTRAAMVHGLKDKTEDRKKAPNYLRGEGYLDAGAESANQHGDVRQDMRYSHWLGEGVGIHARAWVARRLARLRDAPARIGFQVAPRTELSLGQLVNVELAARVGVDGQPQRTLVRVVRLKDREVTALTTALDGKRYAFIAPNGTPDYLAASETQRAYAFVAGTATEKMSNGDDPYRII